ncbi:hypothetical protein NC653_032088 [Populus alba x Populus x berolinensis]|uniref:Uncharacterized protein n=1 Tax=Populus alba x Populus x berolinensis TaxID=444605 RepID=A0AAD6LQX5_9ROSI|nr:hypothetical protein NC653_032088 [Populus alba x Populus x berolinensis]
MTTDEVNEKKPYVDKAAELKAGTFKFNPLMSFGIVLIELPIHLGLVS